MPLLLHVTLKHNPCGSPPVTVYVAVQTSGSGGDGTGGSGTGGSGTGGTGGRYAFRTEAIVGNMYESS